MPTTTEVTLGRTGPSVFPIALGCMGMGAGSWYGASDEAEGIATIQEALERGVNVIDTGDFYGMGKNELLVGRALQGRRGQQRQPEPAVGRERLLRREVVDVGLGDVDGQAAGRASKPKKAPSGPRSAPNLTLRSALSRRPCSARPTSSSFLPMP